MFCKTILYNFYVSLLSSDCPTSVEYLAEEGFALWTGFGIFSIAQQGTQQSADWNTEEPESHFYEPQQTETPLLFWRQVKATIEH